MLGALVTVLSVGGVVRLAVPAVSAHSGVRAQLTFIGDALRGGAAVEAQRSFPEGYFFLYALYGLTWVEVGRLEPEAGRAEALREARWALAHLDTDAGRAPFSAALTPSNGIFYRGWTNWLRGGVLSLQPPDRRDAGEAERFAADSAEIAAAFGAASTPFLQAYPGQAWPVDSTVAMASLRLHDTLLPPRYADTATRWVADVRARLDPATGLLPHTADPETGEAGEVARGTSQSMITRFLVEIDPTFAREQYLRFRQLYVTRPLGLGPAVREYPAFVTHATGDVDSGPLVLGTSLSATVVTIGAARVQGDRALATALASYGELAGLPVSTPRTKRYGFGVVPVGDAFVAWSKMSSAWVSRPPAFTAPRAVAWWWPAPLVLVLLLVAVAPWWRLLRRRLARPPRRRVPHEAVS
ncbi:hypothetical protein GCM10009557_39440 [Virgisporangium ochraceum]|uniref:Uncharacterized protein n=1 Tax=Virgisporangium ochraceum TaxID=65505 RepID=A0A8J4A0I9_9ACTN|nr:hypothetical protein Voc01_072390 [Virgisporangium ochraceum]